MTPSALRACFAAVVIPGFFGCAGARTSPVRDVPSKAAALLEAAPAVYGPDAAKLPPSPDDARVRTSFEGALNPAAKATLHHEPALDLVARVAADMLAGEGQPPAQAMMEWLFWRAGAVSRFARLEKMVVVDVDDLDLQAADLATRLQASVYPESYGVARSPRGRGAQVVVFGRRPLEVEPFPKAYPPGAPITLKVKPLDAFADLSLISDEEGGGVAEQRLTAEADGTFTVTRTAPTKPGRYFVEVTGLDARTVAAMPENPWRRTLLLAPVYVGVPEPTQPDAFIGEPPPAVFDATSWVGKVIDGVNAARRAAGKPNAATDGRLAKLAQERAGVAARAEREPPPDGVLADKVAAAGAPPRDYDASEMRIDSPADYVALRLLTPSSRRRLLGADPLLLGVAVAQRPGPPKALKEVNLVEYDVEPVAKMDVERDRAKVYAALDAQAKAEGRNAYRHDEDVAKAVQQFALDVCRGAVRQNQMKPLIDKARGVGEKYKQWTLPVWRAGYDYTRWQETSVLAKAKEGPLAYAEVGLCQGDLPGKPGGSYVVVIQYQM